ncbi:MAG: hypothetical protein KJO75_03235 [Dactylosporangium sp.]|nr:hypothetical protein [Dactylosporangium sp.]
MVFDDVLMTFDDHRARCALQAMADAATRSPGAMQIVVFTHHAHVAGLAEDLGRADVTVAPLSPPPVVPGLLDPDEVRAVTAQSRARRSSRSVDSRHRAARRG